MPLPAPVMALFALCMFVNAIVFSMLGQGGGILYTPIQLLFGIDFHAAAATSLILIIVASLSSTLIYHRAGNVDWLMSAGLEGPTMAGAFCGGLASGWVSTRVFTILFAALVVISAVSMLRRVAEPPRELAPHRRWYQWRRQLGSETYDINVAAALPLTFVAGFVSGLMGIAGGVLKIPLMVLLFGVPMEIALASSAFMVGLTAIAGLIGHVLAGHIQWTMGLMLAPIVFLGGQVGARLSLRTHTRHLKRGFAGFLVAMAGIMLVRMIHMG